MTLVKLSTKFPQTPNTKLKYYGINSTVIAWINSFLTSRTQSVTLEGFQSDHIAVTSGVPQGSVLGPILLLMYINDLPNEIKSSIRLFADDAIMYRRIFSQTDCTALQNDIHTLEKWEQKWIMTFNQAKCNTLSITRQRLPIRVQYTIHGQPLDIVKSAKYLGVTITSDINWNQHIATISSTANRTLGPLKRNIRTPSERVKTRACQALVGPTLEYATCAWNPHTAKAKHKLEMVERRPARYVTRIYHNISSVTQVQYYLHWQTVEHRRAISGLNMPYKI